MVKRQKAALPGTPSVSTETKSGIDPIEEMVGALADPIIVFPAGGWENDLPERLRNELPLRRLIHVQQCVEGKAKWDEACDLEALLYLYPASLAFPLDNEWSRIYLYLGTKVMGERSPEDIREESLPDYYKDHLHDLKRWIRKKKVEARKARQRQEKAESKRQIIEPVKCEQLSFL